MPQAEMAIGHQHPASEEMELDEPYVNVRESEMYQIVT